MLVLGINTVGDACEAALVRDGVVFAQLSEPMQQGHDARLAPVVERLMRETKTGFAGLDRIAVVVGPGSFTGVRVGVAFARGLALSLDKPAVGVTSLEALDCLPLGSRGLGLLPAKRRPPERTWWVQEIKDGRGVGEPGEADEAAVRDLVRDLAHDVVRDVVREGASQAGVVCGQLGPDIDLGVALINASPSAAAAALFVARLDGDLPPPRPVYVREPDAKPMRAP